MPEGDSIHNVALALKPLLLGRDIDGGFTRAPNHELKPQLITHIEAYGKHLLIGFEDGWTLRTHLGMNGSWHRYRDKERWRRASWRARVLIRCKSTTVVCFSPAQVEWIGKRGRRANGSRWHDAVGPDLIGDFDISEVVTRCRTQTAPQTAMAEVLLNQRVASGIGNVYKCELLFLTRLHPLTPLGDVSDETLFDVYTKAGSLLKANVGHLRRQTTSLGNNPLWVYGRLGKPCLKCGGAILSDHLSDQSRITYWCPQCQPGQHHT